jgi:hypothetical protein
MCRFLFIGKPVRSANVFLCGSHLFDTILGMISIFYPIKTADSSAEFKKAVSFFV